MGFTSGQIAQASVAGQGTGLAMSAIGSFYAAKGQQAALRGQAAIADSNARIAESNASILDQNARIAELGAQSTILAGQKEEQNARLRTAQLKSKQRVGLAANGVDLGSGTATNILTTTDVMGEIDANTIQTNAVRAAWGYRTQEQNLKTEASATRAGADMTRAGADAKRSTAGSISPFSSAAGTLLSGAGQVASSWYSLNKSGALEEAKANLSSDPIGTIGETRGWWRKQ